MDFKQRILTAMNHEEPDRVPVMGLIMDPATINQILGRKPVDFVAMLERPLRGRALKAMMNRPWFWDRMHYGNFAAALESSIKLGFDANWTIYAAMQLAEEPGAAAGVAWHDVFGRVWEMGSDGKGGMRVSYSRALCPTEEKWEAWVEAKAGALERSIVAARRFHRRLVERYGDRIFPIGYAAPGIFENSWQPIGFVEFTKFVYQKPEFVKKIVDFHSRFYLRYLEAVMDSGVEIVLCGDDLGQKTGPLMAPAMVEKLYGESYRRVSEAVHRRGKKLIFHSCGNIYAFLDKFVEWGFDGIITMEPTAGMDLAAVRERVGHKLVLVGNLDVSHLLVAGSEEEVESAVRKALAAAGRGGGYILSAAHSHPGVDAARLAWMLRAAHKWGRYPLRG